jgi:Protein of unknown function (DUF4231)
LIQRDLIVDRLEDQIAWYDRNSLSAQRTFKRCKVVEIIAAALIPFLTGLRFGEAAWIAGGLGVVVTAIEGVIHLNQYQQNWITYRSTCEALKSERHLYLAKAGPYAGAADPHALLAERIETAVSGEQAKWASLRGPEPNAKDP